MGLCIVNVFLNITNKMQRYTIFFTTVNAVHVSSSFSACHQELKSVHAASGICQTRLLLPASIDEFLRCNKKLRPVATAQSAQRLHCGLETRGNLSNPVREKIFISPAKRPGDLGPSQSRIQGYWRFVPLRGTVAGARHCPLV